MPTKIDKQRFRRTYPFQHLPPDEVTGAGETGPTVEIEVGFVNFAGVDNVAHVFTQAFSDMPVVTAVAHDDGDFGGTGLVNVNVYLTSLSSAGVTFNTSEIITGKVHFHAILIV